MASWWELTQVLNLTRGIECAEGRTLEVQSWVCYQKCNTSFNTDTQHRKNWLKQLWGFGLVINAQVSLESSKIHKQRCLLVRRSSISRVRVKSHKTEHWAFWELFELPMPSACNKSEADLLFNHAWIISFHTQHRSWTIQTVAIWTTMWCIFFHSWILWKPTSNCNSFLGKTAFPKEEYRKSQNNV